MTPPQRLFRARQRLEALAVAAVGVSMAAATGAVFRALMGNGGNGAVVWYTAVPTLVLGTLWAVLLRWRKTVGTTSLRMGWLLSVPLAALNGGLAAGLLLLNDRSPAGGLERFFLGMLMGTTFGAMFWIPGLVMVLMAFGAPIAWAQRQATQGLAGQERGDGIVGAASALVALCAALTVLYRTDTRGGVAEVLALSALGLVLGAATMALAAWRDRQRRAFVAAVEAGQVQHFRIDPSPEGKVLVRIVAQGQGYRVADFAEEVAALDRDGAVTREGRGGR